MKLFGVILKLIETLGLTSSQDYNQLNVDVKDWEAQCVEDSDDKMKQMYYKLHKGVFARLLMPFLYFFMLKEVRNLMSPPSEDVFE